MSQQEKMRQTGRTTRIVQYVAEQLYNVGTCIATDHIVYEYTPTFKMLHHFREKVEREKKCEELGGVVRRLTSGAKSVVSSDV